MKVKIPILAAKDTARTGHSVHREGMDFEASKPRFSREGNHSN
jgi:hypothetical protein